MNKNNKYGRISVFSAGLVLPVSLLSALVATWYTKSRSAINASLSNELSYMSEILLVFLAVYTFLWVISTVSVVMGLKKDLDKSTAKISLVLIITISVLSIALGAINSRVVQTSNPQSIERLDSLFNEADPQ